MYEEQYFGLQPMCLLTKLIRPLIFQKVNQFRTPLSRHTNQMKFRAVASIFVTNAVENSSSPKYGGQYGGSVLRARSPNTQGLKAIPEKMFIHSGEIAINCTATRAAFWMNHSIYARFDALSDGKSNNAKQKSEKMGGRCIK